MAIGGHPAFIEMAGQRFGMFVVESRAENDRAGNARWNCRCDRCGQLHVLVGTQLRNRPRKSCPKEDKAADTKPADSNRTVRDFTFISDMRRDTT